MYGLDLIAEIVNEAHHSLEVPSFAAHALPYLAVVFEWSEGDQSIMGRTSTQYFGSGVSDMRIS
jgi:hypothetical protein